MEIPFGNDIPVRVLLLRFVVKVRSRLDLSLVIVITSEWMLLAWWRLRRLATKTDEGPLRRVWTAPFSTASRAW